MNLKHRLAAAAMIATVTVAGATAPALATSKSKWTKAQCTSYKTSFEKKHPKATKAQKTAANKTLKSWGCTITIK